MATRCGPYQTSRIELAEIICRKIRRAIESISRSCKEATVTNKIGITRLGQVHIPAEDVERATAFYKDVLGLPQLFTAGGMAFFNCGGVRLMITRPEGSDARAGSILYFVVADIIEAHRKLKDAGVRFEADPRKIAEMATHDLWMTFFRDSEGNLMALMSEVPRA